MNSYTLFAFTSVVIVFLVDTLLKTDLITNKKFWILQTVVFILTLIFDNFAVAKGIYYYDIDQISGIRLPYAPIEDFLFGFSLVTLNLIIYEWNTRRKK